MADTGPFAAWKRFLALPNDSRGKTVAVAFAVATACAVAVTGATAILRPIQAANRAAEEQLRLESLIAAIPGMTDLLAQSEDGAISTVVVDLAEGAAAEEVTPATLDTTLADAANWTELSPAEDIAGLGARPDYAQIYILRDADELQLVILPIAGAGYNGRIQAMLALHGDMRTIAGMTVTQQQETPGLGARIEEPAWQASFAGKQFIDDLGNLRFAVAKGVATSPYEVDGITGATRTSTAMTRIIRFWLGPDGYGPVIEAMRDGEF